MGGTVRFHTCAPSNHLPHLHPLFSASSHLTLSLTSRHLAPRQLRDSVGDICISHSFPSADHRLPRRLSFVWTDEPTSTVSSGLFSVNIEGRGPDSPRVTNDYGERNDYEESSTISGSDLRARLGTEHQVLRKGHWALGTGHWAVGTGHWRWKRRKGGTARPFRLDYSSSSINTSISQPLRPDPDPHPPPCWP